MGINEDYAGGSWKTNAELEDDVENLSARVASLESDLEQLRELLKRLAETGPNNEREFRGWEISRPLMEWAIGEDE
jgi:hypothetical protein